MNHNYTAEECAKFDLVVSGTTGTDHINAGDIPLISLKGDTEFLRDVWATAEHTVALMLALLRHIPQAHADVLDGRWEREKWRGSELYAKEVFIVGFGRVGQQVGEILRAFGSWVWVYDSLLRWNDYPNAPLWDCRVAGYWQRTMGTADIVTVHVPLNKETRSMFGYEQFCMMKPTTYFVNTSRGAVVDEEGLLRALREGRIAGAALDVVCDEPDVNPALLEYARNHTNLLITPHIAGNTHESRRKTQKRCVERIKEWLERT